MTVIEEAMMAAKNSTTNYGLVVTLSDAEAHTLTMACKSGQSAADKLGTIANGLLLDLAKGGVMVPPEWASRIDSAIGTTAPDAIVEHVESSVGRAGEATRVEWQIDPTQISFYQSQADSIGISLQQQLKNHLDYAFSQGWLGGSAPDPFKILLTQEQYRRLQEIFARDIVTGEDVIEQLDLTAARFAPEEDDPVVESLREA